MHSMFKLFVFVCSVVLYPVNCFSMNNVQQHTPRQPVSTTLFTQLVKMANKKVENHKKGKGNANVNQNNILPNVFEDSFPLR